MLLGGNEPASGIVIGILNVAPHGSSIEEPGNELCWRKVVTTLQVRGNRDRDVSGNPRDRAECLIHGHRVVVLVAKAGDDCSV